MKVKTVKKILSLFLTAALVLTMVMPGGMTALAASNPGSYIFDISEGNITVSAGTSAGYLKVTYGSGPTTTADFANTNEITITGTTTARKIVINGSISGAVNITLENASIDVSGISSRAFCIGSGTTVNLTLTGVNTLKSGSKYAGLEVASSANLNISAASTGSLSAACSGSSLSGAGIGSSGSSGDSGNIVINGGAIKATGGDGGAGIGGGFFGSSNVTITGGTITATGGSNGAGIGGGCGGSTTVTISGGTVTATGGYGGAGIGGGAYANGTVTITGGTVTATGGNCGTGIGGGESGTGTVTISGGLITATGVDCWGTGIGGSRSGSAMVTITGGTVTATGDYYGTGIGASTASNGTVIISGGSVSAAVNTSVYYDTNKTIRVYRTTVTLQDVTAATDVSYTVDGGSAIKCSTNSSGKLYLWLPVTATGSTTKILAAVGISNPVYYKASGIVTTGTNSFTAYWLFIDTQLSDTVILTGETATFSIAATGPATLSYQWYSNTSASSSGGSKIDGATSSSYTTPTLSTPGKLYYYCLITCEYNSIIRSCTSNAAAVTTVGADITIQPADKTVVRGGSAVLSISAQGAGSNTLSYQWYSNTSASSSGGSKIDGATASTYSIPTNTIGSVYYYCMVTDAYGSCKALRASSAACVTVIDSSLAITTANLPAGTIGTAYNTPLTAVNGTSYIWSATGLPAGLTINSSTGTISGTPTDTGKLTVKVTVKNEKNERASADFALTVNETFSIDLTGLSVNQGTLTPAFDKNIVAYGVSASKNLSCIDVTAQTADPTATLSINNQSASSGVAQSVYLKQEANLIPIVVTSSDDLSQKSYIVSVNGVIDDSDLSGLSITGLTFNPNFDPGTYNYNLAVANGIDHLEITATPHDPRALMVLNGSLLAANTPASINLVEESNEIEIMVVAQDASTKTYTINVTREATLAITTGSLPAGVIGGAFSAALAASGGDSSYTWSATGLPATLAMNLSTGAISGTPADTGAYSVQVTVADGHGKTALKTYALTVYQTSSIDLSALSVSGASLNPAFDKNTVAYSVYSALPFADFIKVTATTADANAALTISGQAATSGVETTVGLVNGTNLIPVVVTSPGGRSHKSYNLSVNGTVGNADLASLAVSGGGISFNKDTTSYSLSAGSDVTSVELTAASSDSKAVMMLNGSILSQGDTRNVPLAVGENTLTLIVIAQDATSKTYTITVTRQTDIAITTATLPRGIVGAAYNTALAASGGSGSYTWTTASALPGNFTLSPDGVLSGTATEALAGTYAVSIKTTDATGLTATKDYTLRILKGCGGGAYLITSGSDSAYTLSYTDDGIPAIKVNAGVTGFKYFSVNIEAVTGHSGTETAVFAQIRNGQEINFSFIRNDFDTAGSAQAGFNVKPEDIIEMYIVDEVSNSAGSPVIL